MVEIQEQSSPHTVQDLRVTDWPLKSPEHPHLTAGSGSGRGEGLQFLVGWDNPTASASATGIHTEKGGFAHFFFFPCLHSVFSPWKTNSSYFQGTSSAYLLVSFSSISLIVLILSEAKILHPAVSPMIRKHIIEDSKAKLTLFAF